MLTTSSFRHISLHKIFTKKLEPYESCYPISEDELAMEADACGWAGA
jgi:hypothetical protein